MTVHQGFIQRIDVGRGGLVRVTLIHPDLSTGVYVISDLDADPERFNERLSKLGILRDAMNRAEPVEINHQQGKAGEEIETASRITRDTLASSQSLATIRGLVLAVQITAENRVQGNGEHPDTADVALLGSGGQTVLLRLDMQIPERIVAAKLLDMLLDAQSAGKGVVVGYDQESKRILVVGTMGDDPFARDEGAKDVSGFVETLSLIRSDLGGLPSSIDLAHVRFTTAPDFTGPGNTVGLSPFSPQTLDLLTAKGGLVYELFEAGLRDNLRMRIHTAPFRLRDREDQPGGGSSTEGHVSGAETTSTPAAGTHEATQPFVVSHMAVESTDKQPDFLYAFGAELVAPLASAARPVWIEINRNTLDQSPDLGSTCIPGVPSSDLSPMSLRDLKLPYPAAWRGLACFNHGVYRFQLQIPTDFTLKVDGEVLCLYDSDTKGIKLAHACLEGDHIVTVEIPAWQCDYTFVFDVYRLR